jgi:hypothetical protein
MNDERHKKDALTSTVLQEALLNTLLSVILERETTRSTQRRPRSAGTFTPQVVPVPPAVVSEQDEGTASLH